MSGEAPGGGRTRRPGTRSTIYLNEDVHARLKSSGVTMGEAIRQFLAAREALTDSGYPMDPGHPDVAGAVGELLANGWAV